jgi:cytochrome c
VLLNASILLLVITYSDMSKAGPDGAQSSYGSVHLIANTTKGASIFQNRCSMCHSTQQGIRNYGPNLHGVFGRQAGSLPGYDYSADLRNSRIVWNAETLSEYLADPHRGKRRDKMPYPGLSSKADRDDLISYLEQATR